MHENTFADALNCVVGGHGDDVRGGKSSGAFKSLRAGTVRERSARTGMFLRQRRCIFEPVKLEFTRKNGVLG